MERLVNWLSSFLFGPPLPISTNELMKRALAEDPPPAPRLTQPKDREVEA